MSRETARDEKSEAPKIAPAPTRHATASAFRQAAAGSAGNMAAQRLLSEVGSHNAQPAGAGQPLSSADRSFFEPRLRHDFSAVRVHTGPAAERVARGVNADAFTVGSNIVFDAGRFAPGTTEGRQLLAHELTHVVQQAATGVAAIQRKKKSAPQAWTHVVKITVPAGATGDQRGKAETADGRVIAIPIYVNQLTEGRYSTSGDLSEEPDWELWSRITTQWAEGGNRFVYGLPPQVTVAPSVTFEVTARPRTTRDVWKDMQALPSHIRDVVTSKRGTAGTVDEYERALRAGRKLLEAGVTDAEIARHARLTGRGGALSEAAVDAFLIARSKGQIERAGNIDNRSVAEAQLYGLEALYKRYRRVKDMENAVSNVDVAFGLPTSIPDLSLFEDPGPLNADLIKTGFPMGIASFEIYIAGYEHAFEKEAVAIALEVLLQYEHLLHREYARFGGGQKGPTSAAEKMLTDFGTVREPAQAQYEESRTKSREADRAAKGKTYRGEKYGEDPAKASMLRHESTAAKSAAEQMVIGAVLQHPLVAWQDFPREKFVGLKSAAAIAYEMSWFIATHEAAVQRAREMIVSKPSRIYELDSLLPAVYEAQGIAKDTIFDLIIRDRMSDLKKEKRARDILVAIVTFALAVVSLGGGAVGLLAAGAAFGIGAAGAVTALEEYDEKTTLYLAQMISQEPSAAWAIIAVVGAGLDAAAVVSALKAVIPAAKAFNSSGDLVALSKDVAKVDARVHDSVMRAAGQVHAAEQQLKAAAGELKKVLTGGGKLRATVPSLTVMAAQAGGEVVARLLAIAYYYIKTRMTKSVSRFIRELEEEGLVVWKQLSKAEQDVIRQAFGEALNMRGLPYGTPVYGRLSQQTRSTFTPQAVDRMAAQQKALGRTDDQIVEFVESQRFNAEAVNARIASVETRGSGNTFELHSTGRVGDPPAARPGVEGKYPLGAAIGRPDDVRFHVEGIMAVGDELNVVYAPSRFNISETAIVENQIRDWRNKVSVMGGDLYFDFRVVGRVVGEYEGVTIKVLESITWRIERRLPGTNTVEVVFTRTATP